MALSHPQSTTRCGMGRAQAPKSPSSRLQQPSPTTYFILFSGLSPSPALLPASRVAPFTMPLPAFLPVCPFPALLPLSVSSHYRPSPFLPSWTLFPVGLLVSLATIKPALFTDLPFPGSTLGVGRRREEETRDEEGKGDTKYMMKLYRTQTLFDANVSVYLT